jgi:predicted ATP-grasp superfamily ATP-dependent carboligase
VRILVLDANQRSALAVTRSLGALGVEVFTADTTPQALAGCSRFSSRYLPCPSPADAPRAFLDWLSRTVTEQRIDWVFPCTEISSQLILLESRALGDARIPFADLDQLMSLADKWQLMQLAQRAGIAHPRTVHCPDASALPPKIIAELSYPVVLKPCQSRRWLGDRWLSTSVHIAHSADELGELLRDKLYLRDYPFMLQEFIPGHGAGIFALYDRGQPVTFFAHQRLREKPPQGGVSVLSRSAPLEPQLLAAAKSLLDAAQWHGVAMVEFRVTPQGEPYLMEVNTRFWGSLQLAIDSGVDFPALLLKTCLGEPVERVRDYRIGQRLRWLLGDLDSLYLTLRAPDYSWQHKLRRLLAFFTPGFGNTRHEVNRWGDLGPAWFEVREWVRALRG